MIMVLEIMILLLGDGKRCILLWGISEISPYVYCTNNRLNLTFPDGMDWYKDIN
jgi:hypothetical protein